MPEPSQTIRVIGVPISRTSYAQATQDVLGMVADGRRGYVCVAAVHQVVEAADSAEFRSVLENAAIVTPDGMPVVWALRALGHRDATRVYGPDLTPILLEAAAKAGVAVGFYGGTPDSLKMLLDRMTARYPELKIAYAWAPPFRALTEEEDNSAVEEIRNSGARILFVGLGCPKQERWMVTHCHRLQTVMLGVGAAFDFLAGTKRQAPRWMRQSGLEWVFRLVTEPRRLFLRYLKTNPRFVMLLALQLAGFSKSQNGTLAARRGASL